VRQGEQVHRREQVGEGPVVQDRGFGQAQDLEPMVRFFEEFFRRKVWLKMALFYLIYVNFVTIMYILDMFMIATILKLVLICSLSFKIVKE
jgi:hypothetical protein